jgi:hypothetical protein
MKTKSAALALLCASLTLMSCGPLGSGGAALDPPPAAATQPCARPEALLGGGDWRLIAGRLGDALIDCEGRRALAVAGR